MENLQDQEPNTQVKERHTYREDTLYQLKLELNIRLENEDVSIPFTRNLLNKAKYKGRPLAMYPFFAPYKIYRKGKIQRMTYLERIELFFNRERFEQVIFGKKSKTRKKNQKRKKYEREYGFETLKQENFIFTLKMLFSTAFPVVDNVSRSNDYFRSDFLTDFTLKGTNLEWFPILSGKFDKKFSHLNINNNLYTVTKVIWINDIFNHPLYSKIIYNFRKIKDDLHALSTREEALQKNKERFMRKFYELPADKEKDKDKDKTSEESNVGKWKNIHVVIQTYVDSIKDTRRSESMIQLQNIEKKLAILVGEKGELDTKQEEIKKTTNISSLSENFFRDFEKDYKEMIFFLKDARQINIGVNSRNFLTDLYNHYENIYILSRSIEYIKKYEFVFSKEPEYRKQIQQRIQDIFPRAKEFADQLRDFAQSRNIGNDYWNKVVQSRQLGNEVKTHFDSLADCYTNENCTDTISGDSKKYIEVELDEITKRPADASVEMYEAYLQVNVVEGEVTNKNYHKIKCKYLNEELDNFLDNIVNPQDDWNVKNDKNFFSVKEQVQQANQEIANEASKRKTKKKKGKQKDSNVETKPNVTRKKKKHKKNKKNSKSTDTPKETNTSVQDEKFIASPM